MCWASAPIVEKDDGWVGVEHVVMDCHDVQSVSTEGLEGWRDFGFEHGHVTGDGCVFVSADERRPGVESHACVYGGSHFLDCEVVAAQRDVIDPAILLAFASYAFRDCCSAAR